LLLFTACIIHEQEPRGSEVNMATYELKSMNVDEVPRPERQEDEDARVLQNLGYKQQLNVRHPLGFAMGAFR
jgi:hypothetical protein